MAAVTNDLIHEALRPIRGCWGNIERGLGAVNNRLFPLSARLRGLSPETDAAHTDIANINHSSGRMDGRMSRIGRRIDIVDETAE
ncbi:hypothetical protein [Chelativorans intermedius]|uniref:Uncharacterized protein n=1 Tax=Chelativorans intermedius TaxID=515947 RepID=A0ABV6D3F8_9HYPH|nr:hypothetical protein [Chelativorans intermedius]MCT8998353.1 hypothetical protein [Chelativorans intermedius]